MNNIIIWFELMFIFALILFLNRFLHEMAHYFFLRVFGLKVVMVKFNFTGFKKGGYVHSTQNMEFNNLSKIKKSMIILSGIFINLLIFVLIGFYYKTHYVTNSYFWLLLLSGTVVMAVMLILPDLTFKQGDFYKFVQVLKNKPIQ